jgi:hypothetical protein
MPAWGVLSAFARRLEQHWALPPLILPLLCFCCGSALSEASWRAYAASTVCGMFRPRPAPRRRPSLAVGDCVRLIDTSLSDAARALAHALRAPACSRARR